MIFLQFMFFSFNVIYFCSKFSWKRKQLTSFSLFLLLPTCVQPVFIKFSLQSGETSQVFDNFMLLFRCNQLIRFLNFWIWGTADEKQKAQRLMKRPHGEWSVFEDMQWGSIAAPFGTHYDFCFRFSNYSSWFCYIYALILFLIQSLC